MLERNRRRGCEKLYFYAARFRVFLIFQIVFKNLRDVTFFCRIFFQLHPQGSTILPTLSSIFWQIDIKGKFWWFNTTLISMAELCKFHAKCNTKKDDLFFCSKKMPSFRATGWNKVFGRPIIVVEQWTAVLLPEICPSARAFTPLCFAPPKLYFQAG